MHHFDTIDYLRHGNTEQRQAFTILSVNNVMGILAEFTPVLAGTFPIEVNIESSDLDILCCYKSEERFEEVIATSFSGMCNYHLRRIWLDRIPSIIADLTIDGFEIEIFGQPIPVFQQNGYRHMIAEHSILQREGEEFRQEIIRLKRSGYKTEPAFAHLLGLKGDPYKAILDYKKT